VFGLGIVVCIGVGVFIATLDVVAGVVLTALLVLSLCVMGFGTYCEITPSHVVVRVGPLPVWRVRVDEIVEAAPVSSISATAHFAGSSQAVRITSRRRIFGFLPPTTSISPQDRSTFLKDLAATSPELELCDDGAVRRRSEAAAAARAGE
jgi:hypothetical protein